MDRRQFIHTLNAVVACSVLTESELAAAMPSVTPTQLIETTDGNRDFPKIGVVAVGDISRSILSELASSLPYLHRTIAINTDASALHQVKADRKIRVGNFSLPSHAPQLAKFHAKLIIPEIIDAVAGLDMVLLVAGMGGGAGTGISPVVARVLRAQNILTLGFTLSPFDFEGEQRHKIAQLGIRELGSLVHALNPIRNSDIELAVNDNDSLESVMTHAPLAFIQLCRSITNSVATEGCSVGIDFEDLRHLILGKEGQCAFGFGSASGVNGAQTAVDLAMSHPFLGQGRLQRASAALVAIEAPLNALFLREAREIMFQVRRQLQPNADIIYSSVSTMPVNRGDFRVSILVSGIRGVEQYLSFP